ncbi:MAG TPA: hypothetical protein VGN17_13115 [Bryobacteraceae bacterium]|jgi:hypothetical protein
MPPREDLHRAKSKSNEDFADSLNHEQSHQEGWAVVATFYSALHYVQMYFARFSMEIKGHDARFEEIKKDKRLINALSSYRFLYDLSMRARYECVLIDSGTYRKDARPRLDQIKKQVDHALADAEKARIG